MHPLGGWSDLGGQARKFHFFPAPARGTTALCGKWMIGREHELQADEGTSVDDCVTCRRKLGTGSGAMIPPAEVDAELAIANVHMVSACPRCKAPLGTRCRNITRTYKHGQTLKHPHRERYAGMDR